jgi:hypothetical protein
VATTDVLAFIAPEFATLDPALIAQSLAIAEGYRPGCLDQTQGDEAVALYAAWLLSERQSGGGQSAGLPPAGPLIREREGDRERAWASPPSGAVTTAPTLTGYKARYDALARLCGYGAILTRDIAGVPWVGVP